MNDALALHFAARRYCQHELELLESQYAQVQRIARRRQGDGHNYDADAGSCFLERKWNDWRCMECLNEWYDPNDPVRKEKEAMLDKILKEHGR